MRLDWLSSVRDHPGPYVSVCLDGTRVAPDGEHEVQLRWMAQERRLTELGAPADQVAAAGRAARAPTGHAGRIGRLVVAATDGVALDMTLPEPPAREESAFGPVPLLMPAVRAFADRSSYLLAELDRSGADIEVVGLMQEVDDEEQVEGGNDVLHKVPWGGWAHSRMQKRVDDSVERNATVVAHRLDAVVRRHRPENVLLAGEEHAVSALLEHVNADVRERAVRLSSGGRADGVSAAAREQAVERALEEHARASREQLVRRFVGSAGVAREAVQGLVGVLGGLRRGQVLEVLLLDDATATGQTLWLGREPLELARTREGVEALGASEPVEVPADSALVWALVSSGGGLSLLQPGDLPLEDGIGAILRWPQS